MNDLSRELQSLESLTTNELAQRYQQLFGQPVRTRHKAYLIRKIAWRMQALAFGDLSERARRRAAELANDADIRLMPPKSTVPTAQAPTAVSARVLKAPTATDPRLPSVGTAIVRPYKGRTLRVIVRDNGFEFEGDHFKTLTAVAEHVTGGHVNGYRFFNLGKHS